MILLNDDDDDDDGDGKLGWKRQASFSIALYEFLNHFAMLLTLMKTRSDSRDWHHSHARIYHFIIIIHERERWSMDLGNIPHKFLDEV